MADSPSPPSQHQRRSLELGTSGNLNFPPSSSSSSAPPAASSSASAAEAIPPQASSLSSSSSSSSRDAPPVPVSSRATSDQGRAGGNSSSASGSSRGASSPPPQPGSLTTPIYTALFHYKPQKEDELELRKGDYYTVAEKCQDGWYKGQCLRTGIRGVFPGNYVQIVRPSSAFKPVNPNVSNVRATVPVPPLPTSHSSSGSSSSSQATPRLSTCVPAPTNLGSHSNRSTASVSSGNGSVPPPLLPRVAKNSLGSSSGSASKHSGSRSGAGGASKRSSSAHNHSAVGGAHAALPSGVQASAHLMSITPSGLASNSHGSSQKWAGAGVLHSMSTSSTITPPNAVVGQHGESSQGASHHGSGHSHADRDKERERGRDKDRERREKKKEEREKKSLVKLLYSKSKKSKSPAAEADSSTPRGAPSSDAALAAHTRSGSYPSDSSQGAAGDSQHRKTASLDSTPSSHPAQPPHSARPSRPKPLARERYRCIVSYPPQTEHEMELTVGDIVYVHKKREDGWFKGTHEKTGKTGMFPGSFVEKAE